MPHLIPLLEDEEFMIPGTAAWALGIIKDDSALDPLITLLSEDNDEYTRCMAVRAIGGIGDASNVEILAPLLEDESYNIRECVVWAMSDIGDERAIKILTLLLENNEFDRDTIANALARIEEANSATEDN